MEILINGQSRRFNAPITVEQLLTQIGITERRVAVEVNREIVPRSQHARHELHDADRIEVVYAIGGG